MRCIDADELKNAKPEFMNEKVVRDTKYQTTKDRIYAKAWNDCNSYWLNAIRNIPTVEERPRGKWLEVTPTYPYPFKCSICGHMHSHKPRYCSACGSLNNEDISLER